MDNSAIINYYNMKRILIILISLAAIQFGMQAQQPAKVPARPGVIIRVQPNGDTLHVYLRGDEHWHFTMTTDGWQVQENNKGKLCYARLKTKKVNGEKKLIAVPTCRTAHDADKRSKCEQRWLDKHGIQKMKED